MFLKSAIQNIRRPVVKLKGKKDMRVRMLNNIMSSGF